MDTHIQGRYDGCSGKERGHPLIDVETLQVHPKVYARMLGVSVTKFLRGDVSDDRIVAIDASLSTIRLLTGRDPEAWLKALLPVDAEVTPLDVWRHEPTIDALLDDPESELDRVCPHWRLQFYRKRGSTPMT